MRTSTRSMGGLFEHHDPPYYHVPGPCIHVGFFNFLGPTMFSEIYYRDYSFRYNKRHQFTVNLTQLNSSVSTNNENITRTRRNQPPRMFHQT